MRWRWLAGFWPMGGSWQVQAFLCERISQRLPTLGLPALAEGLAALQGLLETLHSRPAHKTKAFRASGLGPLSASWGLSEAFLTEAFLTRSGQGQPCWSFLQRLSCLVFAFRNVQELSHKVKIFDRFHGGLQEGLRSFGNENTK